jgi:hypothetical protein
LSQAGLPSCDRASWTVATTYFPGAAVAQPAVVNSITGGSDSLNQQTNVTVYGRDADGDTTGTQPFGLTFNASLSINGDNNGEALAGIHALRPACANGVPLRRCQADGLWRSASP